MPTRRRLLPGCSAGPRDAMRSCRREAIRGRRADAVRGGKRLRSRHSALAVSPVGVQIEDPPSASLDSEMPPVVPCDEKLLALGFAA